MGFWEAFLNWLRRYDALHLGCFVLSRGRGIDLLRIAPPGCGRPGIGG
jgi:hypothetical protein